MPPQRSGQLPDFDFDSLNNEDRQVAQEATRLGLDPSDYRDPIVRSLIDEERDAKRAVWERNQSTALGLDLLPPLTNQALTATLVILGLPYLVTYLRQKVNGYGGESSIIDVGIPGYWRRLLSGGYQQHS
jgi:hypothetical protein